MNNLHTWKENSNFFSIIFKNHTRFALHSFSRPLAFFSKKKEELNCKGFDVHVGGCADDDDDDDGVIVCWSFTHTHTHQDDLNKYGIHHFTFKFEHIYIEMLYLGHHTNNVHLFMPSKDISILYMLECQSDRFERHSSCVHH